MNKAELIQQIKLKQSFLCVGLDPDLNKIPKHLLELEDPIFEFNKRIIDSTKDYAVAYKPNIAFYENLGITGWQSLEKTLNYIPSECFSIADAKRGDIGNTAKMYAKTFFETYNFDSITIAPYMGEDSVTPFLEFDNKWAIVLGLTSNKGAFDFQYLKSNDKNLFENVIQKVSDWGTDENLMFVVGATKSSDIATIRKIIPNHFLLVPGVGAQGGSLEEVCKYGLTQDIGLLINSSRGIIYASNGKDFGEAAGAAAVKIQSQMSELM